MHGAPKSVVPCADGTAYVSLLTSHAMSVGQTTQMARNGSLFGSSMAARHAKQVQMLIVLLRSLRNVERCRRDFIVLLGTQVPLSPAHVETLTSESAIIRPTPPLIAGVPTADKLHVWRMTDYSQLVVLDADVMVLQPIDDLFDGSAAEITVAHHPYDHLQAQCGVPVVARGIAAMIVMRPSLATFEALMAYLLRRFKAEQLLYSDQTGLMCYFGNRSRTLPCPYLYDVSMMSTASFLTRWMRNCQIFVRQHVLKNCLPDIPDGCHSLATRQVCDETKAHVQSSCEWPSVAAGARAVHFKGNTKPWPGAGSKLCRFLRHGMPGIRGLSANGQASYTRLDTTDRLDWNASWWQPGAARRGACVSATWGLPVHWAREADGPILTRKCCAPYTLMAAHWNELLAHRNTQAT